VAESASEDAEEPARWAGKANQGKGNRRNLFTKDQGNEKVASTWGGRGDNVGYEEEKEPTLERRKIMWGGGLKSPS